MNWLYVPIWSVRTIAGIAAVLCLIAAIRFWRERGGAHLLVLRLAVVGVLIWIALNPQSILPRERTGKPKLVVLIDSSASMATVDVDGKSRLDAAMAVVRDKNTLATLNQQFALELRRFDRVAEAMASPAIAEAKGDASDLRTALMQAISDCADSPQQAGVLVISDGRATTPDTAAAAQLALAKSVPLWTWTLGGDVPKHDLWIETPASETLAFSGSEVELNATLRTAGFPHRSFRVELLNGTNSVETREIVPGTNGVGRISMRVKAPDSGEQRYVFRVPVDPAETEFANNERAVFLRSVGSKVRVLVAEGQPHWDTKFLVQSLTRNSHVELTAVYRLNAGRHVAVVSKTGTETRSEEDLFPRTAAAMDAFDIIILGRGADAFFDSNSETLLTDFVAHRGGSLVFSRGKPYGGRFQSLAKFEPVAWGSGFASALRLHPTDVGRENPMFDAGAAGNFDELLERLPLLDQASVTLGEKPLAVVLANTGAHEGPVLLAYHRYGQGRAVSLNAGGLWRWAFRETGQEESEEVYQRFWVSLLQWLLGGSQFLPGADVSLSSARRYYTHEQPFQFLISTRNLDFNSFKPRLLISGPGAQVEVEPRQRGETFVAEAGPFPPGSYNVTLKNNAGEPRELSQTVEVVSASVEKRELSADLGLMRQLAEVSGGKIVTARDVERFPDVVEQWEAARQLAHRQKPVWDRGWILAAVVGILGAEWWLRRKEGLL